MTDPKQPHLNGAYYGPSIPPPSKTYHRPGRGGSSCNPFSCCCGCLFNCLCTCVFQILCTILVIVGIIVLIFWLIFRPNPVKFYATDAALTQFEYSTTNNTLYYNLAVNLTIRNPNKRIGIYYDNFEVRGLYGGQRFVSQNVQPFYQGHKNTTDLHNIALKGMNIITLGSDEVNDFNDDKSQNAYEIDVKLYLRIRFKVGWVKTSKFKPKIECDLKLPLRANGTSSSGGGELTGFPHRCDLDW